MYFWLLHVYVIKGGIRLTEQLILKKNNMILPYVPFNRIGGEHDYYYNPFLDSKTPKFPWAFIVLLIIVFLIVVAIIYS